MEYNENKLPNIVKVNFIDDESKKKTYSFYLNYEWIAGLLSSTKNSKIEILNEINLELEKKKIELNNKENTKE
jgi:hypothetical protein